MPKQSVVQCVVVAWCCICVQGAGFFLVPIPTRSWSLPTSVPWRLIGRVLSTWRRRWRAEWQPCLGPWIVPALLVAICFLRLLVRKIARQAVRFERSSVGPTLLVASPAPWWSVWSLVPAPLLCGHWCGWRFRGS
jgi:hypothetical protein